MNVFKRRVIIGLLVTAAFCLILSTFFFVSKIPSIDSEIEKKRSKISIVISNQENLQGYIHTVDLISDYHNSLTQTPPPKQVENMNSILRRNLRTTIHYAHLAYFGKPPSEEEQHRINLMTNEELTKEYERLQKVEQENKTGIYELQDIQNEIKNLSNKRKIIWGWSTVLQILGLAFSNLAILLEFIWKEN